jgi:hypothetical protein
MIEISSLTAMIAAEVMLGLLVLSGLLVLFTILRKQRIRKAASHLAERVQADKEKRSERLKKLLEEHYQLQSPKLDQTLHGIVQTEMTLYQNMLNGFLKDDQLSLQQIDVDIENLVLSYQALAGDITVTGGSDEGADSDEVEALKAENERLAEELKVTMDTMGRMLNEYSTMFADGEDGFPAEAVASANPESASAASESPVKDEAAASAAAAAEATFSASGVDDDMVIPDMTEEELTESSLSELAEEGDEPEEESVSEAESEADLAQIEPQETELPETDITDVENPDMDPSSADSADLSSMADESLGVDEEVSEIIDEVMEIADDMMLDSAKAHAETESASEPDAEQAGESLVDDLSAIDIEIPEVEDSEVEQAEFEPGSLEEEWAKLLEEESSDEEKKDA